MYEELLTKARSALEQVEPLAARGWAPAQGIARQLRWCVSFASGQPREDRPGAFSMGLIATRELDMHGDMPELASLINHVQQEVEGALRASIRAELEAIEPLDALESEHLADALAWVDSGAELCRLTKPATPPKHLVSYFAVVDEGHMLLVDHKDARLWLPTGGHVEPGEHPRQTVLRELKEELGISPAQAVAAPLMVTCTTTVGLSAGHTDVSLWYVVGAGRGQPMTFDEQEFHGVRWFRYEDIPFERTVPHMHRFVRKLRAHRCRS